MEHLHIPYKTAAMIGVGPVLVLAPHPDDEVFGCGGAIMRHVAQGEHVHVVIVTDGGALPGEHSDRESYVGVRQQESIRASGILGYGPPEFWGLPDRGGSMMRRLSSAWYGKSRKHRR